MKGRTSLSIVEDGEAPLETWREHGYGIVAVRHEMRSRGEEINAQRKIVSERLDRRLGLNTDYVEILKAISHQS